MTQAELKMTQAELFDKCLLEIAVDVEAALHISMRETIIDDAGLDHVHRNVMGIFEDNKAKYLKMFLHPEGEPLTVLSAEIVRRQGATIKFTSPYKTKVGDLFCINIITTDTVKMTEKIDTHYFEVKDTTVTEGGLLKFLATETGYYAYKLDHKEDFDLRTIIGLQVMPMTDESEIKAIREQACWC